MHFKKILPVAVLGRAYPCAAFLITYVTFVAAVAWPILRAVWASCYGYYDLGIYSQAIAQLGPTALNPWLTGRQIHIFNDHFDPIIGLVVPLASVLGAAPACVIFEAMSIVAATVPFVLLWHRRKLVSRNAWVLVAALLFHPCVIYAMRWPAHPTTWAVAPAVVLTTAMILHRYRLTYGALLCLFCCKEEFVYVGISLSAWLGARREYRWASAVLASSAVWLTWVFVARPHFLGPTMAYSQKFTQDIWADPWQALLARLQAPNLPFDCISIVLVLAILGGWSMYFKLRPAWGALALCLPLLGIRFLAQMWGFHYNAVTLGFLLCSFLPPLMQRALPPSLIACLFLGIFALDGHAFVERWPVRPPLRAQALSYCPEEPGRLASLARAYTLASQDSGPLLAEENLMQAMAHHPQLYMFNGPQGYARRYSAVLFEKPPHGIAWEFTPAMRVALIDQWRHAPGTHALIDDAYVFYARGSFAVPPFDPANSRP